MANFNWRSPTPKQERETRRFDLWITAIVVVVLALGWVFGS